MDANAERASSSGDTIAWAWVAALARPGLLIVEFAQVKRGPLRGPFSWVVCHTTWIPQDRGRVVSSHGSKATQRSLSTTSTQSKEANRTAGAVSVDIRGKKLSIKTSHDPEFVQQLARYVDNKVRSLQMAAPSAPFDKLLMLASMNVAEELFAAQEESAHLRELIRERADALATILDQSEGS